MIVQPLLAADWPLIVIPTLAGGGLLTMGWMWLRSKVRREKAEKVLDEFKTSAVHAGDVMDKLREQHRRLPISDPDFTVPMEGRTRTEYRAIEGVLDTYRDHWLELMETWDSVQALVEKGGKARLGEAHQLLADANQIEQLTALESECRERLARLGNAHEVAREAGARVDALGEELEAELSRIERREFETDSYRTEMDDVADLQAIGNGQLDADPLTATDSLATARSHLASVLHRAREVLRCEQVGQQVQADFEAQQLRLTELRAGGMLFAEPEAAPEAIMTHYQRLLPQLTDQLNRGAVENAERAIDALRRQTDKLRKLIDLCVQTRDNSQTMLQDRRVALRRLLDDATGADLEEQKLSASYPADAFRRVIDNLDAARVMMATMSELLGEAETAMAEETQHYIRAKRLIDEVRGHEAEVAEAIAAVGQHRAELDTQRDQCERRIRAIEADADRIGRMLQQSRADRDLCNHRYRMARDGIQNILRSAAQAPTDWPHIAARVEECGEDFARVEELFNQDKQLYRQAQSEITAAKKAIRSARSFYRAGVSADTTKASAILLDADRALSEQDYERAVQHANQAEQAARDARHEAERRMEKRQRRQDRRQWDQRQQNMRSMVELGSAVAASAIRELTRR